MFGKRATLAIAGLMEGSLKSKSVNEVTTPDLHKDLAKLSECLQKSAINPRTLYN